MTRRGKFEIVEASTPYQKCTESLNNAYLLIDSFEGALSDFADETIADVYPTEEEAIAETMERVMVLANYHKGLFATDEVIDEFLHRDLRTELSTNGRVKYVSDDGCRYSWQIMPAPIASQEEMAEYGRRAR